MKKVTRLESTERVLEMKEKKRKLFPAFFNSIREEKNLFDVFASNTNHSKDFLAFFLFAFDFDAFKCSFCPTERYFFCVFEFTSTTKRVRVIHCYKIISFFYVSSLSVFSWMHFLLLLSICDINLHFPNDKRQRFTVCCLSLNRQRASICLVRLMHYSSASFSEAQSIP